MAYIRPYIRIAGDLLTAAFLNNDLRDAMNGVAAVPIVRTRGSAITASDGLGKNINMDLAGLQGREALSGDIVVNDTPTAITIGRSGIWHITAHGTVTGTPVGDQVGALNLWIETSPSSLSRQFGVTWPVMSDVEVAIVGEALYDLYEGQSVYATLKAHTSAFSSAGTYTYGAPDFYGMVVTARWVCD